MKRLNLPKKAGKSSVFVKFALSYLLILFIPIAIGAHQYYQTQRFLVDDAAELNLEVLRMSQDIVDRLFLEADDLVTALSVDNEILRLIQNTAVPPNSEQLYNYSLLRTSLNRYVTANKLFHDIFLVMKNNRWAVTTKTSFDLEDNYILMDGKPFGEWIDEAAARNAPKQFYNLNDVSYGGESSEKLIAYVSPLPIGFQGKAEGSVIVFINQKDIADLFHRLAVKNGGFAYIRDNQGNVIAPSFSSNMQGKQPMELPGDLENKSGSSLEWLNGEQVLVSHMRSDQNGWTYIAAVPAEVVFAKADYIKRMIMAITSVILGLGILAALYLAYRNSKPLTELTASMKELSSRMEQQLPLLQASVLERLLKGYYKNEEQARAALAQGRIMPAGDAYFAVAVSAHQQMISMEVRSGTDEAQDWIRSRMECLLEGFPYWIDISGDQADLIVCVSASTVDSDRERLKERWRTSPDLQQNRDGMFLVLGVGRWTDKLCEIWRSHHEARQAMEYHISGDLGRAFWYENRAHGSGYCYYPLDLELKLLQAVKNGDTDGLEHSLQHLEEENFAVRRLNTAAVKQLSYEVYGTLQKLLEQMQFGSDSFEDLNGKLEFLRQTPEAEASWPTLKLALRTVCGHVAGSKKQKYSKLAEAMLETVHSRFTDSGFSLAELAGQFKLTESFISVVFKEHAGETFSDYLEKLRLDRACALLKETDRSINDISLQVGYNSDKTFRRAFKRVYGLQPTSYRESLKLHG